MKHEDEFDGLLSEALREVRTAEPRIGLEGRVLAGVRASAGERKVAWWRWVAVAAAVVLMVAVIGVRRGTKNDVVVKGPVKVEEARSVESAKVPATVKEAEPRAAVRVVRKNVVKQPVVKLEEARVPLPAPKAMTEEEKSLVLLANNHPQVLLKLEQERSVEGPMEVPEIKIESINLNRANEGRQ